jgi:hypothetical protein
VRTALAAVLLLAASARAAQLDVVRRRDVLLRVRLSGTVVTHDVFRLKSTIDGRVESVRVSTGVWHAAAEPLATLSSRELAAMLDARGSQDEGVLEDRWGSAYAPTPIRCPADCYVLKSYLKPKAWVRPQAVLFEAARGLKLVGRVRDEDVHLLRRPGLTLTYWRTSDPERRWSVPIAALVPDGAGTNLEAELTPRDPLGPDESWSGEVIAQIDRDVLAVPTSILIRQGGFYYLPVRVAVGLTADGVTELQPQSGVEEGRAVLNLSDAELNGAERAAIAPAGGESAPVLEENGSPAAAPTPEPEPAPKPAPAPAPRPSPQPDFGDDPYGR